MSMKFGRGGKKKLILQLFLFLPKQIGEAQQEDGTVGRQCR